MKRTVSLHLALLLGVGIASPRLVAGWTVCCPSPCGEYVVIDQCAPVASPCDALPSNSSARAVESPKPAAAAEEVPPPSTPSAPDAETTPTAPTPTESTPTPAEPTPAEPAPDQPATGAEPPVAEPGVVEPPPTTPFQPEEAPADTTPAAPEPTQPVEDIFESSASPPHGATVDAPSAGDAPLTPTLSPEAGPADAAAPEGSADPSAMPAAEELFDATSSRRILAEPGGWFSTTTRFWSDASGLHRCDATLVSVSPEGVVLSRADGASIRVTYRALSVADLVFVRRQIRARQVQLAAEGGTFAAAAPQ